MKTNAERRFNLGWVIEAADARLDEWRARAEGADFDDHRVANTFAAPMDEAEDIAKGLTIAINDVSDNIVTESEALMSMMIWEYALDEGSRFTPAKAYDWLKDGEGAYQGRDNALLVAKAFMRASDWAYANGFDDSEDWEFIPRMIPEIMTRASRPQNVTSDICRRSAELVVLTYLQERDSLTPNIDKDIPLNSIDLGEPS